MLHPALMARRCGLGKEAKRSETGDATGDWLGVIELKHDALEIPAKSTAPPLGVRILQACRSAHRRSRARENTFDSYRGSR